MEGGFSLSNFVSAALGVLAAFAIERFHRFTDHSRAEQEAANSALLSLAQMYSDLWDIWNQIYIAAGARVRERRQRDPMAMEIMPVQGAVEKSTSIDMSSLAFLLRTHAPDIVTELALVERRYGSDLQLERERAVLHFEAQAKLEAAGVREGQSCTREEVERMIGAIQLKQLEYITESQQQHIPATLAKIEKVRDDLSEIASLHLPMRRIITFGPVTPGKEEPLPRAAPWRHWIRAAVGYVRKRLRRLNVT